MKGSTIAAVDGLGTYCKTPIKSKISERDRDLIRIGLDPTEPYFNSGVLLIDCDQWKRDGMTDAAMDCITRFGTTLKSYDQDVLNILFRNVWLPLSLRWNFPSDLFETEIEAIVTPVVYHNLLKPWNYGEAGSREIAYFRQSLEATPFGDFMQGAPPRRQVKRYAQRRVKEFLQATTFFLPSSYQRLQHRSRARIRRAVTKHLVENIKSRRFADVDQNISMIDIAALSPLVSE
jgi:lipopolysaccharide biosynthesis glycosyltransferase